MRIILAGQRAFGVAVFDMLREEGHTIVGVWSPPPGDTRLDALTLKAQGLRPGGPECSWIYPSRRTAGSVKSLEVDLFVAAHSHDFIGSACLASTRFGGIGYHPSLLPRHRGRDAIRWTIHMGDPITGGTVYWLTDNVDGGPVAAQDWCFVPPACRTSAHPIDGVKALWTQELFPMGVRLLRRVLRDLDHGICVEVPQEELNATWEPSWKRPPLHRPELPQLGSDGGMDHIVSVENLLDWERRRDVDEELGRKQRNEEPR